MEYVFSALHFLVLPQTLIFCLFGTLAGLILGAIPGLSGGMAIIICLPLTFGMDPNLAIAVLMSIYIGGISGGYIGSILLGIPGTTNSIATVYDGYEFTKQGRPAKALSVAATANFFGTAPSLIVAMFLSQVIARWAVKLGPAAYFSLCLFAIVLVISLSKEDIAKGMIAMALGLLPTLIGISPISSTKRFTYGIIHLQGGFSLACVMIGLFAGTTILIEYAKGDRVNGSFADVKIEGFCLKLKDIGHSIVNIIRSFIIGLFVGFLPGMGGTISNVTAYSIAKNTAKHPEEFGKGNLDGVWAPEVANNASIGGAVIPMIALGIPGDATTALLLSAMTIQGLTVGPLLFTTQTSFVYLIFIAGIFAAAICFLSQIFGMKLFPSIFKIPYHFLYPAILVCSFMGAYVSNYSYVEMGFALIFILVGIFMRYFDIPSSPFILSFVLGPMLEKNFRNAVSYALNGYKVFYTDRTAFVLLFITFSIILYSVLRDLFTRKRKLKVDTQNK
ncbi:MAG: tripartite tricarboxylate transporter permease [Sphaerochaetaceae bacterium]